MPSIVNKWNAIYCQQSCEQTRAAEVLYLNHHLLPATGVAVDLACGLGANAILLAEHGLNVQAWDISQTALYKIQQYSQQRGLDIKTHKCDIETNPPGENQFDIVVVSNFLYRAGFNSIRQCIRPGGLLFYQTFIQEKVSQIGPVNPDYLLGNNELLSMCKGMKVLVYREEGLQGNTYQGWRNQAMIVAKQAG